MVSAVPALSEVQVQWPIPANMNDLQASLDSSSVISKDVKKVTFHWVLFAADENGTNNAITDVRDITITGNCLPDTMKVYTWSGEIGEGLNLIPLFLFKGVS